MFNYSVRLLILICVSIFSLSLNAKTSTQKELYAEVERQLNSWKSAGRYEDIKIINSHKRSLRKQIEKGNIDLQAIVDEHNYKHKDGKYFGQTMPNRRVETSSLSQINQKQTDISSVSVLEPKYLDVPESNKPSAAYTYLDSYWSGFPATLQYKAKVSYQFPNGYFVHCANWDPKYFDPTPRSVGKQVKGCKVDRAKPDGTKAKAFKTGQKININFGNVGGDSIDTGLGSSSRISGSTLRMSLDGKIIIGKFNAFSTSSSGNGSGGGNRQQSIVGRYYLDDYLIRIDANNGETFTGFIAWKSDKSSKQIDHIYINGEHFWNRKK